jgi:hypothetical protein
MDGHEAGAGNFRRGTRECGKTKKVIEPFDKIEDIENVENGKSLFFLIKRGKSNLFLALEH